MGQIVRRKKKGRPAKSDLEGRRQNKQKEQPERDVRRSLRRRNVKYVFDLDDYFDDDEFFEENDEEERRREKKLKHLLKLQSKDGADGGGEYSPQLQAPPLQPSRSQRVSHAPTTSASSSDEDKPSKKRKINVATAAEEDDDIEEEDEENDDENYNDDDDDEEEEEVRERKPEPKAVDSAPGTPAEPPSGFPLPDKKTLELILNKLQKKDIYGVYAEPVDPEELPDYHDVIEHPMDFATVRSKVGNGSYATLEQFESDVFLICSNAMQYNAPDTIYYKQARAIDELARKKFQKIRAKIEQSEKDLKAEQRMRSGSSLKKHVKRSVSRTIQEPVGSDFSSGATLAMAVDGQNASNALQAGGVERLVSVDGPDGNSTLYDSNLDKTEESLPVKGPLSRFGRKSSLQDENRRATYNLSLVQSAPGSESIFSTFEGENKQLIPVGLYADHSYARSLARFAASLGPVAWKVASKRIEQALPLGFKFGRGWVGDYEPLPTPVLILENCNVKEPPFFAKVEHIANPRKDDEISRVSVSSMENTVSRSLLERKLPFFGGPGMKPSSATVTNSEPLRKEQQIWGNHAEIKTSFSLSPRAQPTGTISTGFQRQNSNSRNFIPSDKMQVELNNPPLPAHSESEFAAQRQVPRNLEMETSKSVELASRNANLFPSGSFKQPKPNGVAVGGMSNGKVLGNTSDSNVIITASSDTARATAYYPQGQGQALTDPVQLMRMLTEKAQNQNDPSNQSADSNQVLSPVPSSNRDDTNNAAAAAARAWMSVGAAGFGPVAETLHRNRISAVSLYDPSRNMQTQAPRPRGEFPAPGMHFHPDKNSFPLHGFVPQGPQSVRTGNEVQFQNPQMVFPQLVSADLSRFQMQSPWRNVSPQMHSRPKQESLPPDLNISFQSSGSPGRPSSGVLVDSQQPDLALQL